MAISSRFLSELVAAGSVAADGSVVIARGFTSVAAGHAAGIYPLTLDQQIDAAECVVQVTPRTTANIAPSVVQTTDIIKTVNMTTIETGAGRVAADCAFDVAVWRISGGAGR
jgi:hypothetical protein